MPAQYITQVRVSPLSSQSSITSVSFSVQAGDVLVAFGLSGPGTTSAPFSINDSAGLTWTKRAEVTQTGSINYAVLWTTTVATTGTISYGFTRPASGPEWRGAVQVWRGVTSIGNANTGQASNGQPSTTLTTGANSTVVMAVSDNTAIDGTTTYNEASAGTFTPAANYPVVSLFSYAFYAGYYADVGAAGSKTVGITYPNAQNYSLVAVELKSVSTEILGDASDGYNSFSSTSYATAKEGGGTAASPPLDTTGSSVGQITGGTSFIVAQGFYKFNVSTLTSYVNPTLKFYSQFDSTVTKDVTIELRVHNWGASVTTTDFVPGSQLASKTLLASVSTTNWPADNGLIPFNVDSVALAGAIEAAKAADGWLYIVAASADQRTGVAPTGSEYVGINTREINGDAYAPRLSFSLPTGPVLTAELYENGVFKQFLGSYDILADGTVTFPWNASTLSAISGADVELRLSSTADVDIGAVQWQALRSAASIPAATGESWGIVLM